MSEVFNHTEQPTQRLLDRHDELIRLTDAVEHTGTRKTQIEHELACLVFELWARTADDDYELPEQEIPSGLMLDDDIECID